MSRQNLLENLKKQKFNKKIVDAFASVPRENFIPSEVREMAYKDTPLPIGEGQTISQPYTIALMLSELDVKPYQNVLEIGSGSGYVLAILSELVGPKGKIFGVERVSTLAESSKQTLSNYKNINIFSRNGSDGLPEHAPFDRILISAALNDIPEKIMSQLSTKGGILVAPKGSRFEQSLIVIQRKSKTEFEMKRQIPGFVFVPFVKDNERREDKSQNNH